MSRSDLGKSRFRKNTEEGTDVGVELQAGKSLHDGDVLSDGNKTIIIRQLPEKTISIKLKNNTGELPVLIGHAIGNLHRPIQVHDDVICFPIQAASEADTFEKLFAGVIQDIEMSVGESVFVPHAGADVHEHD